MNRQIRRCVFETNSSSTHSITVCMKNDYDRWETDDLFLYNSDYSFGYPEDNKPKKGIFYTKEEVINFMKANKYNSLEDFDFDNEDEFLELAIDCDFFSSEWENDYLETFYEEFTTPSGDVVVAFGQYGYDG